MSARLAYPDSETESQTLCEGVHVTSMKNFLL